MLDVFFDDHLNNQLHQIEDDLLEVSFSDPSELKSFVQRLADISERTTHGLKIGSLSSRTIALAHSVARSGRIIADRLLQLHRITNDIAAKRQSDLADIFSRITLSDGEVSQPSPLKGTRKCGKPSLQELRLPVSPLRCSDLTISSIGAHDEQGLPTHTIKAYEWLSKHYHNPYPTLEEKKEIIGAANVPLKQLNDWFVNVRRRIGWAGIAKRNFRNSRQEIVDCAHRVFVQPDPESPVKKDVVLQFMKMKAKVERLCNDHLHTSDVAKNLEEIVFGASMDSGNEDPPRPVAAVEMKGSNRSQRKNVKTQSVVTADNKITSSALREYVVPSPERTSTKRPSTELDFDIRDESESQLLRQHRPLKRLRSASSETAVSELSDSSHTYLSSSSSGASTPLVGTPPTIFSLPFDDMPAQSSAFDPFRMFSGSTIISDYQQARGQKRRISEEDSDVASPKRIRIDETAPKSKTALDLLAIPPVEDSAGTLDSSLWDNIQPVFPSLASPTNLPAELGYTTDSTAFEPSSFDEILFGLDYSQPVPANVDFSLFDGLHEVQTFSWKDLLDGEANISSESDTLVNSMTNNLPSDALEPFSAPQEPLIYSYGPQGPELNDDNTGGHDITINPPLDSLATMLNLDAPSFDISKVVQDSWIPDCQTLPDTSNLDLWNDTENENGVISTSASLQQCDPFSQQLLNSSTDTVLPQFSPTDVVSIVERVAKLERLRLLKEEASKLEQELS